MTLVERLEKVATEFDRERWQRGAYRIEKAETCDLLREAAKALKENARTH